MQQATRITRLAYILIGTVCNRLNVEISLDRIVNKSQAY